jgi:hypothetical protein
MRKSPAGILAKSGVLVTVTAQYIPVMKLEQFAMERMQSTYENQVAFNLSESGVQPLLLDELIDDSDARDALLREPLRYTQSNGTPELRAVIAAQYPGALRRTTSPPGRWSNQVMKWCSWCRITCRRGDSRVPSAATCVSGRWFAPTAPGGPWT